MPECLPDLPRYIRQRGNEWQGADHPDGPWRSIPAPQSGLPWPTDRDPHLPSPEVCDWLLSLEWSQCIPVSITNYPQGGPFGIIRNESYDLIYARAALGADEIIDIRITKEAHELLKLDAGARAGAAELKRRECEADDLARKEDRQSRRVPEVEIPASVAPEPTGQPLSPAAQAVLNAWLSSERGQRMLGDPACLAAALRAVADQVLPAASPRDRATWSPFAGQICAEILAIAAELEKSNA